MVRYHNQKKFKEERVYVGLQCQRDSFHHQREVWHSHRCKKLANYIVIHTQEADGGRIEGGNLN